MKRGCSCPHLQYRDTAPAWQVSAHKDLSSVGRRALSAHLCCWGGPAKQPTCLASSCPGWVSCDTLQRSPARAPCSK